MSDLNVSDTNVANEAHPSTAPAVVQLAAPLNVSPEEFLSAVVGPSWQTDAWVCAFPDNKFGFPAAEVPWDTIRDQDVYFSVGAIADPRLGRKGANFKQANVLVVDDVGEVKKGALKTDPAKVLAAFGEPSYKLASSPSSAQWGYIFDRPITDAAEFDRLIRACIDAFSDGDDPGMEGVVRLMRAPWGRNNKPARKLADGTQPAVVLLEWTPARTFDPADLAAALGAHYTNAMGRAAKANTAWSQSFGEYMAADPILIGLDRMGLIEPSPQIDNGYIRCRCPWEDQHTGAHEPREGYNPERAKFGTGWSCFHTSHGRKTDEDVKEWLRGKLGDDEWRDIEASAHAHRIVQLHANMPFTVVDDPTDVALSADDAATSAVDKLKAEILRNTPEPKRRAPKIDWAKARGNAPINRVKKPRPAISWLLTRGTWSQIIGASNIGKGLIAMGIAISIASERAELVGFDPYNTRRLGDVFFVSNEDGPDELAGRRDALLDELGMTETDLKHWITFSPTMGFRVVQKEDNRVVLSPEMDDLAAEIKHRRLVENRRVALVIIDTQATAMDGLDENSNSDGAAAGSLLAKWTAENNVSLLLVHHTTKDGQRNNSVQMADGRGASALGASTRAIGGVKLFAKDASLPASERGHWIELHKVKTSYGQPGGEPFYFRKSARGYDVMPDDEGDEAHIDPIVPDANGVMPMLPREQQFFGLAVYKPEGPTPSFNPQNTDTLMTALDAIDAKIKELHATNQGGVSGATHGTADNKVHDIISDALGCSAGDAGKVQELLVEQGLLEETTTRKPGGQLRGPSNMAITEQGRTRLNDWRMPESIGGENVPPAKWADSVAPNTTGAKPAPKRKAAAAPQPASVPSLPEPETPAADNDDDDVWRDIAAWHDRQGAQA